MLEEIKDTVLKLNDDVAEPPQVTELYFHYESDGNAHRIMFQGYELFSSENIVLDDGETIYNYVVREFKMFQASVAGIKIIQR